MTLEIDIIKGFTTFSIMRFWHNCGQYELHQLMINEDINTSLLTSFQSSTEFVILTSWRHILRHFKILTSWRQRLYCDWNISIFANTNPLTIRTVTRILWIPTILMDWRILMDYNNNSLDYNIDNRILQTYEF